MSYLAAMACVVVAAFCWFSIRDVRFKNGGTHKVDPYGEYLYTIRHGKLKFAAGLLGLVVCLAGLLGCLAYCLLEMGVPVFMVEKVGGLIGCLVLGSVFWRTASRRPHIDRFQMTLAEVTRQGMFLIGMFAKGGAWLMLFWIMVDVNEVAAIVSGIGGLLWAIVNLRRY